jgi:hypothetical protein
MSDSHDAEYLEHLNMWKAFTRFTIWGIVLTVAVLVGMALTLL